MSVNLSKSIDFDRGIVFAGWQHDHSDKATDVKSGSKQIKAIMRQNPDEMQDAYVEQIKAGAQVITANTFTTNPYLFDLLGRAADVYAIDKLAVRIATRAVEETAAQDVAVAGSISADWLIDVPQDARDSRQAYLGRAPDHLMRKAQALADAGCDLLLVEMIMDPYCAVQSIKAAVSTGLPVWLGFPTIVDGDGDDGPNQKFMHNDRLKERVARSIEPGIEACYIIGTELAMISNAIEDVQSAWGGPVGACPQIKYARPGRERTWGPPPKSLAMMSQIWVDQGVRLLGGCCDFGPDHIAALHATCDFAKTHQYIHRSAALAGNANFKQIA